MTNKYDANADYIREEVDTLYPCPCCGHLTFSEVGGYEICDICGWEDDPIQSADPAYEGTSKNL
jgi:hypothetical protein